MNMDLPDTLTEQLFQYVSRETIEKLDVYINLLSEWNRNTSLVQFKTLENVWSRHVLDSLQILPHVKRASDEIKSINSQLCNIIDIGTGAGFPGMVLAISGINDIYLCESNVRKCVFLEEVARLTGTKVTILNNRIEEIEKDYDLILSRACADLTMILSFAQIVSRETRLPRAILHKGKNVNKEILEANKKWSFSFDQYPSILEPEGCILDVFDIKPK